jgi:hypothetical protein
MFPHLPPDLFTHGFLTCLGTVVPVVVVGSMVVAVVRCAY